MENCIFCKIIAGEIPSPRLYEDDKMIVIRDIEPKAKLHYLCIPKTHFALLNEMDEEKAEILKHCFQTIAKIEKGVNDVVQSNIAKFAEVLNTTVAYLMGWEENIEENPLNVAH